MTAYDLVLLTLDAFDGRTSGKTLLQKRCFFVALLSGGVSRVEALGFQAHYYGPYSPPIDNGIGQMRAIGLLMESRTSLGIHEETGFEVSRYDYELTGDGRKVAAMRKRRYPAEWAAIEDAVQRIKKAGDPDYVQLAIAAKVFFLLRQKGGPSTKKELIELARKFGWRINDTQEQQRAWAFLKRLRLVRVLEKEG